MQFSRITWGALAGTALALALTTTATAGAAPAPNGAAATIVAAAASGHSTGAAGPIRDSHPPAPSAEAKVARPEVHPASNPAATYRQFIGYTTPFNVPAGGNWWAEVYCPDGMLATGGGESNTNLGGFTLHGTYALANGSGWHVDVTNGSASTAGLTVYTVCFSGLSVYKQITQTAVREYGSESRASVDCPVGDAVGSGGWAGSYDQFISFQETTGGAAWVGFGHKAPGGAQPTAQAICAGTINNTQRAGYSSGPVGPGQDGSVHATCPAGTWVVSGGGGVMDGVTTLRVTDTYPTYPGQGWYVYVHNDTNTADQPEVWEVCGN